MWIPTRVPKMCFSHFLTSSLTTKFTKMIVQDLKTCIIARGPGKRTPAIRTGVNYINVLWVVFHESTLIFYEKSNSIKILYEFTPIIQKNFLMNWERLIKICFLHKTNLRQVLAKKCDFDFLIEFFSSNMCTLHFTV